MIGEIHGGMLADRGRNAAFARAIRTVVRPGMTVLDAGAGTGLLALLCARAGAARVYALERDPALASLAREIARRNGFERIIRVECLDARAFRPDRPVDLIVSETVGVLLFDEGILALRDALAPHLAPGGRFLPARLELRAAPLESPRLRRALDRAGHLLAFDYAPRREALLNLPLSFAFRAAERLAPAAPVAAVDLSIPAPGELRFAGAWPVRGRLDALGLDFTVALCDGVTLSTAPEARPTHWGRFVLPLPSAELSGGIAVALRWHGEALRHLDWSVEAPGYAAAGSTMLASPGRAAAPAAPPRL